MGLKLCGPSLEFWLSFLDGYWDSIYPFQLGCNHHHSS